MKENHQHKNILLTHGEGFMKVIMSFLVLTLFAGTAPAQVTQSTPAQAEGHGAGSRSTDTTSEHFSRLANVWMQAYNDNDSATLASMYSEDAEYISAHVAGLVAHGRNRIISNFQRGIRLGGHIDAVSILSIQASCDLATLVCKYEATNGGVKVSGRNLLVVRRVNNNWLIVLHMTVV
jgi:ketosteroid isomerase-like protein